MADAGYSADNKLVVKLINEGKFIPIAQDDLPIVKEIKSKINNLVAEDKPKNSCYMGKTYIYHTAFEKMTRVLIKINQIRQKNWFFEKVY